MSGNKELATQYNTELSAADDLYHVADTYVLDGAFLTAADRLRKAADHLERAAELKQKILSGATS